jgi:hypothetical protein
VTAFVRVSGPPNSNLLVGYPGISATLVTDFTLTGFSGSSALLSG